jgi:MoxR-like ATPase
MQNNSDNPVDDFTPVNDTPLNSAPATNFNEAIQLIDKIKEECSKILVGQRELVELMITCVLSDGHILLEGVPGIAKTLSAKVLAKTIQTDFSRIQFTPDLMPADIIGTSVFNMKDASFTFKKGPIFSNFVLIDEINRAPAKTQSALFEVMEEKQISFDGETYQMGFPFLIIATQNPIEQEGTYRLPEAQLDRFLMKIVINYPSLSEEVEILERFRSDTGKPDLTILNSIASPADVQKIQKQLESIFLEDQILNYISKLVHETRNHGKIYLGASPRASLAIMRASKVIALMSNRDFVIPDDIQYVAPHILNHRIILTPEAEMGGHTTHQVIEEILKDLEVPR